MMLFRTPAQPSVETERHRSRRSLKRYVISEELFHDALSREIKRADRFEEAFVILLITPDRRRPDSGGDRGARRIDVAVATGGRRRWLVRAGCGARPDSTRSGARCRRRGHCLANAFRRERARRLPADQAGCCSIRCETYSSRSDAIAPVIVSPGNQRQRPQQRVTLAAKRALDTPAAPPCSLRSARCFSAWPPR